uniref:Structural protein VP1 n=1 Tax=Phylloscopus inornatus ambidensovirus TaxID=2794452 RepID=A0A8E7G2I2_9VIRU|nr:MAG: structural protein VP1 [Phylloscopus inornatus ambidensovirus]
MSSVLRRRVPWRTAASETTGLLEGEAVELTTFGTIEEASLALDASGIGTPVGVAVGVLAAVGFGAYEIYEHIIKSKPTVTLHKIAREFKKANYNQQQHIDEAHKRLGTEKGVDILPLENEKEAVQIVPLEAQHSGFVPPPFKYLGPGNSLDSGIPYNDIDADAKIHDTQYSVAETKEDVYKSDSEFLTRSGDHIIEGISGKGSISDTIGAALGGIGIGAKHLLEKATGSIQYPNISGKPIQCLLSSAWVLIQFLHQTLRNLPLLPLLHQLQIYFKTLWV